jgi:hypothetical protein
MANLFWWNKSKWWHMLSFNTDKPKRDHLL